MWGPQPYKSMVRNGYKVFVCFIIYVGVVILYLNFVYVSIDIFLKVAFMS